MYLAIKEIKHEKLRYGMIIAMIALISWLIFILTGLAQGLGNQNTAAIDSWNFKSIALNKDADVNLRQSLITSEQISALHLTKKETLLGQASVVAKHKKMKNTSANFIGLEKNGFIAKDIKNFPTKSGDVLLDDSFKRSGLKKGSKIKLNSEGKTFTVIGFVDDAKINISPVIYGTLSDWQSLRNVPENFKASAVASQKEGFEANDLSTYSKQKLIDNLPGYEAQNATFGLMIGFLLVISLIIMGVFQYIITIQKLANFAVLRAQGIPSSFLVKNTISQAFLLGVIGLVLGTLLTFICSLAIPSSVPLKFEPLAMLLVGFLLLIAAVLGSLVPIRTILKVDPANAIGG